MRTTDLKNQHASTVEKLSKYEHKRVALYLAVPFLLCIGIIGVLPWLAR